MFALDELTRDGVSRDCILLDASFVKSTQAKMRLLSSKKMTTKICTFKVQGARSAPAKPGTTRV